MGLVQLNYKIDNPWPN